MELCEYADLHEAETREPSVSWLDFWSRKAGEFSRSTAPARGRCSSTWRWRADFERYTSAVVDHLVTLPVRMVDWPVDGLA